MLKRFLKIIFCDTSSGLQASPTSTLPLPKKFFLTSDFLAESLNATKINEENHLSYSTISLKKPHSFYQPQLTRHWKINAPATQPFLTLQIFQQTSGWCQKKIGTAPFLCSQELHSRSNMKEHVCMFLYISLRKFLLQRRIELLSGFIFYLLSNFLNAAHCLGLRKIFYSFSC